MTPAPWGCLCPRCAPQRYAWRRGAPPPGRRGVRTGEGPLIPLPIFVQPGDVEAYKQQIDPAMIATDAGVDACSKVLDQPTHDNWKLFFASWVAFRGTKAGFFDAPIQWSTVDGYAKSLRDWQILLQAKSCGQSLPDVTPQSDKPSEIASTVKTVAVAGALIAGALVLREVLK